VIGGSGNTIASIPHLNANILGGTGNEISGAAYNSRIGAGEMNKVVDAKNAGIVG
jgi:hypothetical protein